MSRAGQSPVIEGDIWFEGASECQHRRRFGYRDSDPATHKILAIMVSKAIEQGDGRAVLVRFEDGRSYTVRSKAEGRA